MGAAEDTAIWPRTAAAVRLVQRCLRCWRRDPWSGRPLGLDYPALSAAAEWMRLERGPDLWERVQWLESEMLRLLPAPCDDAPEQ